MNKFALIAAAALTAATFGTAAIAQDSQEAGSFTRVDANADGMVSWDEALGAYPTLTQELFAQADTNGDGSLDEAEYTGLQGLTAGMGNSSDSTLSAPPASSESSSAQ